jgi:hypothetical protein
LPLPLLLSPPTTLVTVAIAQVLVVTVTITLFVTHHLCCFHHCPLCCHCCCSPATPVAITVSIALFFNIAVACPPTLLPLPLPCHPLAGNKSQDKKDSDNKDEVAVTASTKYGGKKKPSVNYDKEKTFNHCKKKGHVENKCWKKNPESIPVKVKVAWKKKLEKKC